MKFFQKKVERAKWQAAFELLESYRLFDKVLDVVALFKGLQREKEERSLTRNEELLEKRISDPVIEILCDGIYRQLYRLCDKHGWSEDQIHKILYRKERLAREK